MPSRRGKLSVVAGLVGAVLVPMWLVGLQGEPAHGVLEFDFSVSGIRPLDGPLPAPAKLSPNQVGVVVWMALLGMIGVLYGAHRFMNRLVRPAARDAEPATDGGRLRLADWILTEDRWVVAYEDSSAAVEGLVAMAGLTVVAITFAALFSGEYVTLARTQYFAVYAAGLFLSLAMSTVAYYAWFMPHVEVAEER